MTLSIFSCDFFADGDLANQNNNNNVSINSISLDKRTLTVEVGGIAYLSYSTSPYKNISPSWNYDASKIKVEETSNGVIITGKEEGYTSLTVNAEGHSATCIITVSGTSEYFIDTTEPYIYSNSSIIQLTPGQVEQVNVSLYQGTAADIDGYTWTIDNPAICEINPTGQYCNISAKTQGYARIKITHTKSAYPYYIGVYVLNDISNVSYITTSQNVLSLNKADGSKSIKVDMVKPTTETYKSTFNWNVLEGSECISIVKSNEQATITPIKTGTATVRVTNEAAGALYPLDIMVRVIEIVENVYIDVETVVNVNGETPQTITAKLVGLKENAEYSNDDFKFEFENEAQNICSGSQFSNTYSITGLKNGSTTLFVSHPKAEYKRQILVITENQIADSIDSSCYITSSQNYIKTKVGAEDTVLNVLLKGGTEADQNNFKFTIKNTAADGTNKEVIKLITPNGQVEARAAMQTYIPGTAYITPCAEGEAVITVTNPKCYYPLEILVKVLNKDAILTEPLYFMGEGIITFLNSESHNYNVKLLGNGKKIGDENDITWNSSDSHISINSNGEQAILSTSATGNNISHLYISHPKVETKKDVLVLTADTEEDLRSMHAFYSNKLYFGVNVNSTEYCYVSSYGYDSEETYSGISWTSDNPQIASVEYDTNEPLKGIVHAKSPGTVHITCKYYDNSVTFTVTVYPEGYVIDSSEKNSYLSTSQNVVNLKSIGLSKTVNVIANGLSAAEKQKIIWQVKDNTIARINANGLSGSITALKEGETEIEITHPECANKLTIYVRIGSEYVISNEPVTYIAANTDLIAIVKDAPQFELSAYLVKTNGVVNNTYSFSFSIDNEEIATITPLATGKCYVKPKAAGQTEIIISHPDAEYDKKILVVVGNTEEELAAFRYITTSTNVISVGQGSNKSVSVSIMNSTDTVLSGYSYESENPGIATIISQSGNTFVVKGNEIGTTRIKVTHTNCSYPLYIIVQVVDPIAAAACPYIQVTQPVLNLIESTSWTTVTAELVGGTPDDQKQLVWTSSDNTILEAYGQNGVGKVRAKASGICYLTVSHVKAPYEQRILCICDKASSVDYSISISCANILSIKPDAGDQAISATLVNGTTADRYNFNWSLDVYNIVSLTYSGAAAVITPLQEGTCTLTVSHPKSPYDQKIIIKVQSYDTFGFSSTNKTIVEGTTNFVNMQVPASSVKTHIVYSTSNDKICTISGTSSVAQITGTGSGTCTVKAQLVATSTNIVQSESDMLVYVSPADTDAVYISGSPTVYTIEAGEQRTLSASITGNGITAADYYNLKWKSSNPEICEILGASTTGIVMGSQVYALGKKAGEALITISHEKTKTELIYYVIVPGTESSKITLSKSYLSLNKGDTSTIKATITGGSTSDYQNIVWTADKNNGVEICRVMGYGQEVTIYGINSGSTDLIATLPNGSQAKCQVVVESNKEVKFDLTTVRVQPGQTKKVKYHVSPATAGLTWVQTDDTYFTYVDDGLVDSGNGEGYVEITGIKQGSSSLKVASSYGNTATLQIVCNWDYKFELNRTSISGTPNDEYIIDYEINPPNSKIEIENCDFAEINKYENIDGTGKLIITPLKEAKGTININAINTNISNSTIFSTIPINMNFTYDIQINPVIIDHVGKFSNVDTENGIIYIGDGEDVYLSAYPIAEQIAKADVEITNIKYTPLPNMASEITAEEVSGTTSSTSEDIILLLKGNEDYKEYDYAFTHQVSKIKGSDWNIIEESGWTKINDIPIVGGKYSTSTSVHIEAGSWSGEEYHYTDYQAIYDGGILLKEYQDKGFIIQKNNYIYGVQGPKHSKMLGSWVMSSGYGTGYGNGYGAAKEEEISLFRCESKDSIIYFYGSYYGLEEITDIEFISLSETIYYSSNEVEQNSLLKLNPYKTQVFTLNDNINNTYQIGTIKITYSHMGKNNQTKNYIVYKQIRPCNIYQQRN